VDQVGGGDNTEGIIYHVTDEVLLDFLHFRSSFCNIFTQVRITMQDGNNDTRAFVKSAS
jgi:hypothetical protein